MTEDTNKDYRGKSFVPIDEPYERFGDYPMLWYWDVFLRKTKEIWRQVRVFEISSKTGDNNDKSQRN
jgi:hypothetical protein